MKTTTITVKAPKDDKLIDLQHARSAYLSTLVFFSIALIAAVFVHFFIYESLIILSGVVISVFYLSFMFYYYNRAISLHIKSYHEVISRHVKK